MRVNLRKGDLEVGRSLLYGRDFGSKRGRFSRRRIQRLQAVVGGWVLGLRKEAPRVIPQFLPWAVGCYSLRQSS